MSKPPHTIDLPALDELFDDSFERNARRVLESARTLQGRYESGAPMPVTPAAIAAVETGSKKKKSRRVGRNSRNAAANSSQTSGSWLKADIGPAVGLLLLAVGLIAVSFAVTLFVLSVMDHRLTLQTYIWPAGIAGQLLLLIGLGLRTQPKGATKTALENEASAETDGQRRLDTGHGVPQPAFARLRRGVTSEQI